MIILTNEILKSNSKLVDMIKREKEVINLSLKSQENLKDLLLDAMQKFAVPTTSDNTCNSEQIIQLFDYFKESLELSNKNISSLKNLLKQFHSIKKLNKSNINSKMNKINTFNTTYLETNESVLNNTLQIEKTLNFTLSLSQPTFSNIIENDLETNQKNNTSSVDMVENDMPSANIIENDVAPADTIENDVTSNNTIKSDNSSADVGEDRKTFTVSTDSNSIDQINDSDTVENTLIVSELKGKVFLPYTVSSLNCTLKDNPDKYSSIEDIIKKEYIVPYELFKNPAISRFKQAFRLMRTKEKSSIKEAFDLGVELFFNYNLHPAIISACRNLDELDIYLDYLENNETNKFDCFQIKFEVAPIKIP